SLTIQVGGPLLGVGNYSPGLPGGVLFDFDGLLVCPCQNIIGLVSRLLTLARRLAARRRQTNDDHAMRVGHRANEQIKVVYVFASFPGLYKEIAHRLAWNWFEENVVFASLDYKSSLASAWIV